MTVAEPRPTTDRRPSWSTIGAPVDPAARPDPTGDVLAPMGDEHNMTPHAELEQQLRHHSLFLQAVTEQQGKLTTKLDAYVTGLLDVLIEQGVLDPEALQQAIERNRRAEEEAAAARHQDGKLPAWPTVVVRDDTEPLDVAEATAIVDCADRMAICHAACCSLPFPLSVGEIEGGQVKWDLGHPYMIRHDEDGWCAHNDRGTGGCTIYDDRPAVCRGYDCSQDERIWKDFEAKILNEEFFRTRPRRDFHFRPVAPAVHVTISRRRPAGARAGAHGEPAPASPVPS
jgi:Fe-S-cluster containining protein